MLKQLPLYILQLLCRFRREEQGAALVEYGILIGLIALICIASVAIIGTQISNFFSIIGSALSPGI